MKRFLVIGLFIFVTAVLSAQTIDLEEARLLALANSRSLARFETLIRSSVLSERDQLYTMLPVISANYSASMSYLRDWEFVNPFDTFRAGVNFSLTQLIFNGGRSFINRAIRSIATESERKSALAEYFNVLDAVDNAYYAVLEATAALNAAESLLQSSRLNLQIAEVRAANGIINRGEYLRVLANMESQENSVNQARRTLSMNTTRFRNLTGITEHVELEPINFEIYDDVIHRLAAITDDEADALFTELWYLMTVSNPSIAQAALASKRAELDLSNAKRELTPTIRATIVSGDLTYSALGGFNTSGNGSISITGTIPIDFWNYANRVERSTIARDNAAVNFLSTQSSLEFDLQSTLFNLFRQAGSILSSRRILQYTEQDFEFVSERYRLSQSSVTELNSASTSLINSQNSLNSASFAFLQSLSRLRSLCALDDEQRLLEILLGN